MELAKVYRANVFTFRLLALFLSRELWELHGLVCHYLLSLISIVQVTWRQSTRLLGVPLKPKNYHILFQCPDSFLKFLQAVRDSGSLDEDVGPPVVHCSAGIGRSGTFCLVDSCLVLVSHFFLFCARRASFDSDKTFSLPAVKHLLVGSNLGHSTTKEK